MKERENELTSKANSSNLGVGVNIMAENGEGPKPEQSEGVPKRKITPSETPDILAGHKLPAGFDKWPADLRGFYLDSIRRQGATTEVTLDKDGPKVTVKEGANKEDEQKEEKITEEKFQMWSRIILKQLPKEEAAKYARRIKETSKLKPEFAEKRLLKIAEDISKALDEAENRSAEQAIPKTPTEEEAPQKAATEALAPAETTPAPNEEPEDLSGLSEHQKELFQRIIDQQIERRRMYSKLEAEFAEALLKDPDFTNKVKEAFGGEIPSFDKVLPQDKFDEADAQRRRAVLNSIKEGQPIYVPESLEEVAKLIMNKALPEYRLDRGDGQRGEKCLLKEDGTVNTLNVLDWARDNLFKAHMSNPTAEVSFFSDIATQIRSEGFGSPIGFYELTFTDSFFLKEVVDKNTGEVLRDVNGNKVTKENKEYKALKDQMLMEVFLLQLRRNPAVALFLQNRGEREKLINTLGSAFALNPDTRSDFLVRTLTMPSMAGETIIDRSAMVDDAEEGALVAKREGNFLMGDAVRQALAAYIHIYDYEQLADILGKDSPLFQYAYDVWNGYEAKPLGKQDYTPEDVSLKDPKKAKKAYSRKDVWYYTKEDVETIQREFGVTVKVGDAKLYELDKKRKLIPIKDGNEIKKDSNGNEMYKLKPVGGEIHPDFLKRLNVFDGPTPEERDVNELRERIRLSIMKSNGISYREAELAELHAFSMGELDGVFAKDDTEAVTHEWWARLLHFQNKRNRERSETRHSSYGSKYNLEGFRRIGLNMLEGVRDIRGRSLQKIILGGEGRDINVRSALKNNVDFERDADSHLIKFVDQEGNEVVGPSVRSATTVREHRIEIRDEQPHEVVETRIEYKDENGNTVDIGDLVPKVEAKPIEDKVEFKSDEQKYYVTNHVITGSRIYEWMMEDKRIDAHKLVIGYDAFGNPIIDSKLANEIRDGIEHDLRYMLSTHQEINYGEKSIEPKRIYVRDEKTRRLKTKDGEELDEDWFILENGKRTDRHGAPEHYVEPTVMTKMESMFGAPAAKYIQAEIEKRGLDNDKEGPGNIFIEDSRTGEQVRVNLTMASASEFRTAVWLGAFDYLNASEIESHRTRGSGYAYHNSTQLLRAKDGLIYGEILDAWEVNMIARATKTENGRIFLEDVGESVASGALPGLFKALRVFAGGVVS